MHESDLNKKQFEDLMDLQKVQLITLMRIYDTLLVLIGPDKSKKVEEVHKSFEYLGPFPFEESTE